MSVMAGILLSSGLSVTSSIIALLLLGCTIGLINGSLIGFFEFPPFIVTLGTMGVVNSMALILCEGKTVYWDKNWFDAIAGSELLWLPIPFWIVLVFSEHHALVLPFRVFRQLYLGCWK